MKIALLLSRIPYPLEKGDKLRAFHQLRVLSQKHEIHLICTHDAKIHPKAEEILKPYCTSIHIFPFSRIELGFHLVRNIFRTLPMQVGYFYSPSVRKRINKLLDEINPEVIYCQLIRTAEYVRNRKMPKVIDFQDVFSINVERRFKHAPFYVKPLLLLEYKRLKRYETEVFQYFSNSVIISEAERELLPFQEKNRVMISANGVDMEYFCAKESFKDIDLVFTGNMGYPPNIDAACYLADEILPEIRKEFPYTNLTLAGANPFYSVKNLQKDFVTVTGWVEDIRGYYSRAKIFVAPMRMGTGLQNKLLEAMAMKTPCITTSLANVALGAKPGEEILIADTKEELVARILQLIQSDELRKKLSEAGYLFVKRNYSWEKEVEALEKALEKAIGQ